MMRLRAWQSACIEQALKRYKQRPHFLCLATPGAGKTTMAAELSKRLIEAKHIDFILCFSPSLTVAEGMRQTMMQVLERRFDGLIGAAGCSYTYQSLLYFKDDFWQLFDNYRVLVIFDEIHHCSGTTPDNANAWGEEILLKIQDRATYTLALTGTPWRSDQAPIVLSHYLGPDNQIHCDYIYGLRDAVRDGVCRMPRVVLIDNERIDIHSNEKGVQTYRSLDELFKMDGIGYTDLIAHPGAVRPMLLAANQRLNDIRQQIPGAAGLVVAASVDHASMIAKILETELKQSVVLVTYKTPYATEKIARFRTGDESWIVSVGMISEGTDLPRLHICCHLSHIRTELHYRQVLGRVLRVTGVGQEGWLYTFAEPDLVAFAQRIASELPEQKVVFSVPQTRSDTKDPESLEKDLEHEHLNDTMGAEWNFMSPQWCSTMGSLSLERVDESPRMRFLGKFREQILATFF